MTTFALLLVPSLAIVISPHWTSPLGPVSVAVLTFLVVGTGLYYRLVRPDTFMLTVAAGSVMTWLTTLVGRLLIVKLDLGIFGMFMMTGLVILEATLVVSWLRRRAREDAGMTSIRAVITEAVAGDLLPADAHERARAALQAAAQEDVPWYLRVLIGGAAWVGAWFLLGTAIGLVGLAVGERVDAVAIVLGLILMPAGVVLRTSTRGELQRQLSLVSVLTGQLLFVGGLGAIFRIDDAGGGRDDRVVVGPHRNLRRRGLQVWRHAGDRHGRPDRGLRPATALRDGPDNGDGGVPAGVDLAQRTRPAGTAPRARPGGVGLRNVSLRPARPPGHPGRCDRHLRLLTGVHPDAAATAVAADGRVRGAAGVAGGTGGARS